MECAYNALKELIDILGNDYINDERFKRELLISLKNKTGNDNFGILIECMVNKSKNSKMVKMRL